MPSYIDIAGWIKNTCEDRSRATRYDSRKRSRALAEMDINAKPTTGTPKRSRANKTATIPLADNDENADLIDTDETPRATISSAYPLLRHAPSFTFPPATAGSQQSYSNDAGSSANSDTSGQSESSKKRKRSGSPQKQIAARRFAVYPIQYATMSPLSALPEDVKSLVRPIKHISQNIAVLPSTAHTPEMEAVVGDGEPEDDLRLFRDLFHKDAERQTVPSLADVQRLVKEAAYNQDNGALEATWNCHVHFPVLEMARKHCRYRHQLRWCNITPAIIHPKSLVPDQRDNEKIQSRKVDFCLSVQLDEEVQRRLALENVQLNQTDYGPVKHHALVLSIETKLLGDGGPEARNQISTWAEAQIKQLRFLLQRARNPTQAIPPLPVLLVQGNDWTLWCLKDEQGQSGTFYDKGVMFGSTESVMGTYKVIAGLQILMLWAVNVWWPWIEEFIVNPLAGGAAVTAA